MTSLEWCTKQAKQCSRDLCLRLRSILSCLVNSIWTRSMCRAEITRKTGESCSAHAPSRLQCLRATKSHEWSKQREKQKLKTTFFINSEKIMFLFLKLHLFITRRNCSTWFRTDFVHNSWCWFLWLRLDKHQVHREYLERRGIEVFFADWLEICWNFETKNFFIHEIWDSTDTQISILSNLPKTASVLSTSTEFSARAVNERSIRWVYSLWIKS